MIVYKSRTCPPWLEGAGNLQRRDMISGLSLWAVGDPLFVSLPDELHDVEQVNGEECLAGTVAGRDTWDLRRNLVGWKTRVAVDANCNSWSVPSILNRAGVRNFTCPIGPDFLPHPTKDQARILEIGVAVREELIRQNEAAGEEDMAIDTATGARWAAEILCFGNHISVKTLLKLCYLDEMLIVDTLTKAVCHGDE